MAGATKAGQVSQRGRLVALLMQGVSAISLGVLTATGPAFAQATDQPGTTGEATSEDEIVVTGIRSSLRSSQEIKRNADVFVDSITAEDIGALPDRSVTEALQRVPGVAINRFAAAVDPDHFSIEGSGAVVRGLTFVRSEFNGRDAFTANNGRGLSFADVPPELLGGVDVFKSPSADMIEGGIAGTVNLRTLLPFDRSGTVFAANIDMNYSDFVEEWTPSISALISSRWELGDGSEFGLLVDFVDSQLKSRSDGTQASNFACRTTLGPGPADCAGTAGVWFPRGAAFRSAVHDRGRVGNALAAQWESADDTVLATFQFLRSEATESWTEHAMEIATDVVRDQGDARPVLGTTFGFDDDGVFTDGVITGPTGWRDDGGYNWRAGDCTGGGCDPRSAAFGLQSNNIRRDVEQEYKTSDIGFNLKWTPNETWSFNFDYQHVKSTVENLDTTIWGSTYQNLLLRMRGDDPPVVQFLPPSQDGTNIGGTQCTSGGLNQTPTTLPQPAGGDPASTCTTYFAPGHESFSDPYNSFWRSAMDHVEDSEGTEDAARIDVDYDFGEGAGWLDSVRVGARWAERDNVARFSQYNWGVLSEQWGNGGPVWFNDPVDGVRNNPGNGYPCIFSGSGSTATCSPAPGAPTALSTEAFAFENFFRGEVRNPTGNQPRLFYANNTAQNYTQYAAFALAIANEWGPRFGTDGCPLNWVPLAARCFVNPGTPFRPSEINPVLEENNAYYGMLRFGDEFEGGGGFSGNIGLRYVKLDRHSEGGVFFAPQNFSTEAECANPPNGDPSDFCEFVTPARRAQARNWANGAFTPITGVLDFGDFSTNAPDHEFEYWLPSFNLKLNLSEEMLLRFAASRAITPPEFGLTRNFANFALNTAGLQNYLPDPDAPNFLMPTGNIGVGNPGLKPIQATNYDASFEWYFADVGSLTFAVFYKELEDVITNSAERVDVTNNGATFSVVVNTPINAPEPGSVKGFEIAYQQFYDFLPAPFDGFGINANYTYIQSDGVKQNTLSATDPDVAAGRVANIDTSLLPLQGLSEHNINVAAIYEKGPLAARLAYSWRSEFLLTVRDVIVPFAPIMNEDTGQLDGSIFYTLNDNWKIGLQGVNLGNEITQTSQVLNDDLLRTGRSWFMNDRRYTLSIRAQF